jgi:hypothetical protein
VARADRQPLGGLVAQARLASLRISQAYLFFSIILARSSILVEK